MVRIVRLALLALCTAALLTGCTRAPMTPPPAGPAAGRTRPAPPLPAQRAALAAQPASTPTVTATAGSLLPTVTPFTATVPAGQEPESGIDSLLPTPTPVPVTETTGVTVPLIYRAAGTFASTTVFSDSVSRQQGEYEIVHVAAANAYGADEVYRLTTQQTGGADTVTVYLIGDEIAVHYGEEEWVVTPRAAGSSLVNTIQPITDLAAAFDRLRPHATLVGSEQVNGIPALHYRVDNPGGLDEVLARFFLLNAGEVSALQLDAWLADPAGELVRYVFRLEITGARVLDADFQQVTADQTVTWTYALQEVDSTATLTWPKGAPTLSNLPVPGFAPGEFPLPPQTTLVSTYAGLRELTSAQPPDAITRFYQEQLAWLGWTLTGEAGLYHCTKADLVLELLISADDATGGSRVSVFLPE